MSSTAPSKKNDSIKSSYRVARSAPSASSTTTKKAKRRPSDLEDWLWIALPTFNLLYLYLGNNAPVSTVPSSTQHQDLLLTLLGPSAWVCWIQCVLHKGIIIHHRWPSTIRHSTQGVSQSSSLPASTQGNLMVMALIPSLAHAVAMVASLSGKSTPSRWVLYAKWTTLSASTWVFADVSTQNSVPNVHPLFHLLRILPAILVISTTLGLLYDPHNATTNTSMPFLATRESILWIVLHTLLSQQYRSFVKQSSEMEKKNDDDRTVSLNGSKQPKIDFQMASWGEYQTLVFLLMIGIMECLSNLVGDSTTTFIMGNDGAVDYYPLVAQSGVMGCLLSAILVAYFARRLSWVWQLICQVVGPLAAVELGLSVRHYHYASATTTTTTTTKEMVERLLPRCLQWLLEFFLSTEPTSGSTWPRYWGVLYWCIALVVLIPPTILIVQRRQSPVVITRKWFHLVAILLFAPTTHFFPQLMALGYAVALCGLVVLETLRRVAPALDDFYRLVQDPTKDSSEGIILSHICLILGCAMPLWLSEAIEYYSNDVTSKGLLLLSQWGILSLGVGDAMGAVVGKTYGQIRWGKNQRTVEGSLAMWISMMSVGRLLPVVLVGVVDQHQEPWVPLLVATTFVTLVEAYTIQMDNLVLPLAGSLWIVLLSHLTIGAGVQCHPREEGPI